MLDIVLFEPEIPANTGNIIRLCANTGAHLHLIQPLGFDLDDKRLRRAGLDYHEWVNIRQYASLADYVQKAKPNRLFALTTKGSVVYSEVSFQSGDALLFGPETRGLPAAFLGAHPAQLQLYLPMRKESRSLNLSNTVAVVLYEAMKQLRFPDAVIKPRLV
ncbi:MULTISPECIES: tRNA (uridine(34)/cytosine(34)/5-carboxymethylaminomethyluridine(34)-2'-O)-methyltransferase TrmL [Methylomonas]|uniref:tRNA (uridine(34)/cytosine(34)/5- carboxymethylaminomethyluridine(34)-2'-O)- methyltransferase TrmL n=1 Tax=Methylomonas TaxID=416 RepID=UPI0007C8E396|nr:MULTISPECIES: tRNA (uridine(34)/cytosine(34)/5-carboxymethylaminomethyluridine(34)-2'-O)-methyltransferase TrmL [Methylomonas]ANE56254.1 tRNA (cytosine(34)-2'-O)-methyltransferase TrmL [Methylomonas sp. DH-1]WNB77291.1 tRNA (uridine(34)/cytosine(34)/5-carboxymethylaminomethyluridine(34)-2'-O)-methyltransferase TrmL [Methylomonas koyamae]